MRLGKILCVAICIIGLLGGCSVEDDMSNVYSELSTENLTMEITSVDDGYTESLTTSADKVALVDLTESEWEEITEMMRVYCTNVYVSTGKTTFGAGEHSFYVYVDKTPWIGGNQPRYFVQIERITNTENGQDCIEDLGYYIWVGADQSWHITPIGRFELGEKHFVGEGHFLIEDTDIFIFDEYPLKEKRLVELSKMTMERIFSYYSDIVVGQNEFCIYIENMTQYDDSYPVWYVVDDEVFLLSIFYTGYNGEDRWDITQSSGWKTIEELEYQKHYMTVSGSISGELIDAEQVNSGKISLLCSGMLGYLQEKMWIETESISGDISGVLYIVEDDMVGQDADNRLLLITEAESKVLIITDNKSGNGNDTLSISEEECTEEMRVSCIEHASAVIEFKMHFDLND